MNVVALPTWAELKEGKGEIAAEVEAFRSKVKEAKADGDVTFIEIAGLCVAGAQVLEAVVVELFDVAVRVSGMTPDQRRQWISDVVWEAYKTDFDFDIPWVPEPAETWVEKKVIKDLAPQIITRVEQIFHKGATATTVGS